MSGVPLQDGLFRAEYAVEYRRMRFAYYYCFKSGEQ